MIQQLNPTIPVVTPRGKGNAVGWIDYGMEDDLYWIVFQADTCECWVYAKNHEEEFPAHAFKRGSMEEA